MGDPCRYYDYPAEFGMDVELLVAYCLEILQQHCNSIQQIQYN